MGNKSSYLPDDIVNMSVSSLVVENNQCGINITSDVDTIAKLKSLNENNKFGFAFGIMDGDFVKYDGMNIRIISCDMRNMTYPCCLTFRKHTNKVAMHIWTCGTWIAVDIEFTARWRSNKIILIPSKIEGRKIYKHQMIPQ